MFSLCESGEILSPLFLSLSLSLSLLSVCLSLDEHWLFFVRVLSFSLSLFISPFRSSTSGRRIGKDDASTSTSLGGARPFKYKRRRSGQLPVGASRRSCDRHRGQKVVSLVAQDQCEEHAADVRACACRERARFSSSRSRRMAGESAVRSHAGKLEYLERITERSMSEG